MIRDLVRPHVLRMICGEPFRPEMRGVPMERIMGVVIYQQQFWFRWRCPQCDKTHYLAGSVQNPRCLRCING